MPQATEYMYIKTNYMGYISALKMSGPIVTPMKVPKAKVVSMLISGIPVEQYNETTKQTRALTLTNVNDKMPNVKPSKLVIAPPQVPVVLSGVTKPTETNEDKLEEEIDSEND